LNQIEERSVGLGGKDSVYKPRRILRLRSSHVTLFSTGGNMREHEYALLGGVNRAKFGRLLGLIAASVSAAIGFVLLAMVDLAKQYGLPANLTPSVLSLVGAGAVFTALYWLFDRYAWRWSFLKPVIKVPNLAGEWNCKGQTINPDKSLGYVWSASITIHQSWDKIKVHVKTDQSSSSSIAAAIVCDDADGFHLMYNYRNQPGTGEKELHAHVGFCELLFHRSLFTAEGEYFNGNGRYTFGTMKLTRK
jgi:hypothetical protein